MKRIMMKKDLIDEISERTQFHKKYIKEMLDSLEEIVIENMNEAIFEEASEVHFMSGVTIGAYRKPECEAVDPRNQEKIITPEKIIPYAKFPLSFKRKLNNTYGKND